MLRTTGLVDRRSYLVDAAVWKLRSDRYSHLSRTNNVTRGHTVVFFGFFFRFKAHKSILHPTCMPT